MIERKTDAKGLDYLEIANGAAEAAVYLLGAQLASWTPKGQKPVVWRSPLAPTGVPGKSLRGGVPVCWPWFGNAEQEGCPAHGFARNNIWEVVHTLDDEDISEVVLSFSTEGMDCWPHRAEAQVRIVVGADLLVELTTRNTGDSTLPLAEALHTYFGVSDIGRISIEGLDGVSYLDKVGGFARAVQAGAVRFSGETDRVYLDTEGSCVIDDPDWGRKIVVAKEGSRSTVVWNPWDIKGPAMGDLGDHWRQMVCIEAANAHENSLTLAPGEESRLATLISLA